MKSIPHFIKGSESAIEIPKEGTMFLWYKMHLPCITKLSNSGMYQNPIDMLETCTRQTVFMLEIW